VADTVRTDPERARPLAALVDEKTGGNPFFVIQFLTTLYQERLLELDEARLTWRWEIARIKEKGYTDNVVDFMVRRLSGLPAEAQDVLETAACIGNKAPAAILALAHGKSDEQTLREVWEAIREGLILRSRDVYTFAHDRVHQAAYSMLSDDRRSELHLRIGRLLLAHTPPEEREEHIFEIVSQLNAGAGLVTDPVEKYELVRLNSVAGRRARASIAYQPARSFLSVATSLLPEDCWEQQYDFSFHLFLDRAECEYLSGAFEQAEALFDLLLARARTNFDKATVYELRLKLDHVAGKYDEAVAMGLKALRLFEVEIPDDDEALVEATRAEAEAITVNLRGRTIADVGDGPEATDPTVKAMIGLLSNVTPAAYIGNRPQVFPLVILKLVNCSLKFGHTKESCVGYSAYGLLLVSRFDDPRSAYEFSEMSIKLNQKLGDISRRGTVLHLHGDHINFWLHHIATDFPILERGFLACLDAGDLVFAGYIAFETVWQAVERGDMLDDILDLSKKYATFARQSRNEAVYQTIRLEQQFLRCLKGQTRGSTTFDDDSFEEAPCLEKIAGAAFTCGLVFYHMMKVIAAFLSGDDTKALEHTNEARRLLSAAMAMPMEATHYFFHALVLAGVRTRATEEERPTIVGALGECSRKLGLWAHHCPANFLAKHALVSAEIARVDGDELRAERLYEQAIQSARENGFIHWEGIANELASRSYRERGFETIANVYLREARACYVRWGAEGKVRQLDQRHPRLMRRKPLAPSATFAARAEQIDLLSVVKASQTISGEFILDKLVRTLLQVVLEHGGGQAGYLIFVRGAELTIEAQATLGESGVATTILPSTPVVSSLLVPASIVQYVRRTKERVILDDAAEAAEFSSDPYITRRRPRSVLCLPIIRQAEVAALLYLENNLTVGAFTADRLVVLELLASQAAISLDSAQLLSREQAGRAAAEEAERRSSFLAQASPLLAESLDYEHVLTQLTRLVVRFFADWSVVDLLENAHIRRLTGATRDASKEKLLEELRERYPPRWEAPHPSVEVLRSGEPLLLSELDDEALRRYCVDERHFEILVELGARAGLVVPLVARGQTLGALSMGSAAPGRRYGPADLELARELSHRAALAIDNARLYRDAQEAIRLRDDFISVASHELNTPLTSLMLSLQSLLKFPAERRLESATMNSFFQLMVRQGSRLTRLVGELLDVSRIQANMLLLQLEEGVDLVEIVQDVVSRSRPDLERAACPLTVHGPAHVFGRWDRSRLEQVITNLLSNAIKFGARNPIEITLAEEAGFARISVTDHGMGIAPSQQQQLFGRFTRGVSAEHYGGLGLGLYITRRIVEAHGGSIKVESQPGAGATFTVHIPSVPPAEKRV
jgi:predicted ATPase/signal transduction histidine kinase